MMATEKEDKTTANWMKEAQKGYIRMGVLILLNKKPSHGYEIMKEINKPNQRLLATHRRRRLPYTARPRKIRIHQRPLGNPEKSKTKVYKITQSGELILRHAILKQTEIFNNIGSLFREFSRDVLNVEASDGSMPTIPSPFSAFLEEKAGGEETFKQLENQRNHIHETVKMYAGKAETPRQKNR
jgi:DNA-binding PadR family transcriptional regulator